MVRKEGEKEQKEIWNKRRGRREGRDEEESKGFKIPNPR
jgi:hypothetical protein